ncbi:MAG: hypothetical protein RNU03_12115 [Candidatus Sedimenticola sp. (ex Thyasira tokunagai)]
MPTLLPSGALRARRVSSAASRLPGITSLRFALHGWQRLIPLTLTLSPVGRGDFCDTLRERGPTSSET